MAEGASPPAVDNLDGKLDKVSIRRGGKGRSPASINGGYRSNSSSARSTGSSPASHWARTPGQHNRQFNNSSSRSLEEGDDGDDLAGAAEKARASGGTPLSRDQREAIRFSMVGRKKDFKHMERVDGRWINVLEGLELHTGVFSAAEQKRIVACVYDVQEKGRNRQLRSMILVTLLALLFVVIRTYRRWLLLCQLPRVFYGLALHCVILESP